MENLNKVSLILLLLAVNQTAFGESFIKKGDLKGNWQLKKAACTTGKIFEELKDGTLIYDGKNLSLRFKDEKSKKEVSVLDTQYFVIQEDLLTVQPKASNSLPTFKIEKKSENTLTLKFPIVGLAGDCPEYDLKVLTFERIK